MDIHSVRQRLRTSTIYEIPLRVTFYARVSSESDEQLNSLVNQVQYYSDFIRKNRNWTYVDGYVDEGLSAATTKRRESFHRMIEDGKAGLFDLIITKEITRFARNTLDSIQYTRDLLQHGVAVFFQNDNINTVDEDSELRLTIMSGIAQDELRKLSSRVKFGHQQAIKNNVVLGNSRIYGYKKDNGRLVIDETEAPMVRELFNLYSTDRYSMKQIETMFWEKGYRNHNGNKIAHTTMSGMISNPKYKGYYVGNKVKVIDLFTKKQKFLPQEEWVMFKDETGQIVPAIVDEDLWDQANAILQRRSEDVKSRQGRCNHANLMTGKLICTSCGVPYYRRESADRYGHKNSKWVCSGKIKNGSNSCPSVAIYESELKKILFDVFQETEANAEALIAEYTEWTAESNDPDLDRKIEEVKRAIDLEQRKKDKLLDLSVSGQITDQNFASMTQRCDAAINKYNDELDELEQQKLPQDELRQHIAEIRKCLNDARKDASVNLVTKEFVDKYISQIYVTPDASSIRLQIKIFSGETSVRYIEKLKSRAGQIISDPSRTDKSPDNSTGEGDVIRVGHMFKNICPIRNFSFQRADWRAAGQVAVIRYSVQFVL